MVPKLQYGFCGSSLHTSSLVIAWLQVILSTLGILLFSVLGTGMIKYVSNGNLDTEGVDPNKQAEAEQVLYITFGVILVFLVMGLLVNAGLLMGIYKRNYCIMMPYLILAGVGNVMNILSTILIFFAAFMQPYLFLKFIVTGMITALGCYCWLILYNHYQEIKEVALINQSTFRKV